MSERPLAVVVMGVSGCGKSTVAALLAERLEAPMLEGDALHSPENKAKMAEGIPLTDADRWPWLAAVGMALGAAARTNGVAVAACSALKRGYREALAEAAGLPIRFVHVHGAPEVIRTRMMERSGHFMPPALLDSQLETLEIPAEDESPVRLDLAQPPDALAAEAASVLLGEEPL